MHFNAAWESFVKEHLRKPSNITCLKESYPHHCNFCAYVGTSHVGLQRHYDHHSNAQCYSKNEQSKNPDVLGGSSMVLSDLDALDSDQIDFISSHADTAYPNRDEELLVFGDTGSGKKNNSDISVVIFANRNDTIVYGKGRDLRGESGLSKNSIRDHISLQRSIVNSQRLSEVGLSNIEKSTMQSLAGLAVNPPCSKPILGMDDSSDDERSVDSSFLNEDNLRSADVEGGDIALDDSSIDDRVNDDVAANNPINITDSQRTASQHQEQKINFGPEDHAVIDLFLLLKKSNAPLILFDRIIDWTNHHKDVFAHGLNKRKKTVDKMMTKLYNDPNFVPLPRQMNLTLTSNKTTSITKFSLITAIQEMINNKSLMTRENLLWNVEAPWLLPDIPSNLGEPNSGSWYQKAMNECHLKFGDRSIVLNMSFFIDGLKIDKYGKLISECVLGNWLIFKRPVRNLKRAWFPLGFIEDQRMFSYPHNFAMDKKIQDYHDMVACIFEELKEIQARGGVKCDLDFGEGLVHRDVILYPDIQYIIGDCKGMDTLCGRKGTHSLLTPWLCRDCNVPSMQGDDVNFVCQWTEKRHIQNKTKEELQLMSHHSIVNAFHDITFGWCSRNIHGNSPPELLHQIQLGICDDIGKDLTFTSGGNTVISDTFKLIYPYASCQSNRDMPDLHTFRRGISSVKSLKAKERFVRVFCVYLSLMNSSCIQKLREVQKKGSGTSTITNSLIELRGYLQVVEETLLLHAWCKQDSVRRVDVLPERTSRCEKRFEQFSSICQKHLTLDGNEFNKPKMHFHKHIVEYIRRHGVPSNLDGSLGELFGKLIVKDHAQLTNKSNDCLSYDIATRYAESRCFEKLDDLRVEKGVPTKLKFLLEQTEGGISSRTGAHSKTNKQFTIEFVEETDDGAMPDQTRHQRITIKWIRCKPPSICFDRQLLHSVCVRMFLHEANLGGRIDTDTKIPGFTDYVREGIIFRANPYFRKKGEWFDWAYFEYEGYEKPVPARIMMFLDLTHVNILDDEVINDVNPNVTFGLLTNEVWCIILAARDSNIDLTREDHPLTDNHFDSVLSDRIEMETQYRLVPASSITGPAFVIMNEFGTEPGAVGNTAIVVKPMDEWPDLFVTPHPDD